MTGALTCLDITVSAGTVTFATGASPTLAVSGSMSLLAGTVWSSSGAITFNATTTGKTVTTNGVSISGAIAFSGVGGGWTLGSALTCSGISFVAGTFDTSSISNYALTTSGVIQTFGTATRTINFNASTITISINSLSAFSVATTTNLTFNAGTSQLNLSATVSGISSVGVTFYNVSFTSTALSSGRITGANTFNNLAVTAPSTAGLATVTFDSAQTINGTLSTTGTAGNRRVFFSSTTYGISQTLTVNSAPSLTDADFRGIYVIGTSAPISGTRIGNRGECSGITFDTPKTVYKTSGSTSWSGNTWAASSGGLANTDNFPLPQDTAVIDNSNPSAGGTFTLDTAIGYCPNVDFSARTNAVTVTVNATTVYGNWTNGSGVTLSGANTLTFSGGGTQTITSAGKTFSGPITVDTYGGTVQLADALNIGLRTLTITNGTFDTKNFNVTASAWVSSNNNVRTINLGSSTITNADGGTLHNFSNITNLTFNAGTSTFVLSAGSSQGINSGGLTFYNVTFTGTSAVTHSIIGANTFNNLTFTAPASAGLMQCTFAANQTISGTLTCAGASAVRRIFLRSDTIGTQYDLTVGTLSANDCDFRDIEILGAAAGTAPTRAGDCGGNAGITFPAAKTVYWNLAGAQNWSATGWCPSSGGTPDINQFPLAQDTAKFDDTGSVTGTITINAAWNIGTFDASARTSAMTLTTSTNTPSVYGDWKFGTGVTSSSTTGTITFSKPGTQTITSNGVQFGCPVTIAHPSVTVQLADALSINSARLLTLGVSSVTGGTFDAVTYNVTTGLVNCQSTSFNLKMGSGTWTLSGTGSVWNMAAIPVLTVGTSTIVLSDTSTTARTFAGGGLYYNKLTIGGTTGTSTLTISGANTFGELASTKTVAHTITFPSSTTTTIGKWSVTGTVGNVVTLAPSTAATTYTISIAGPANSGIDYLSVSYCAVSTTSPGEFYVGANSTNTAGNTGAIIFTATPAPRTLYWVGGTGNWSSTTKWSTSSGGGSGAAIPTSLDSVNFDSLSNATAYTATIDAGVTIARCAAFTMNGPLTGNVTFAGTVPIAFHGNVTFAATGITRTYTGAMSWAGNSSYTFTTNGLALVSLCTVLGVGSTWTLGSALSITGQFIITRGSFNTSASNYSLTTSGAIFFSGNNVRSASLNGSTITSSSAGANALDFSTISNLTFTAGTAQINLSGVSSGILSVGVAFYNVSFTGAASTGITISGANTFNNLSFTGQTTVGINAITFSANQTINGTLTLPAGTAAAYRNFLASDTIGTQRTLTVNALAAGATDVDFRDIAIAGAAAPISGTRFGDCKGNSGITFPGAKTVYWRLTGSFNWGVAGSGTWSATSGGTLDATQFPLAQDTAVFPAATYPASGSTITINANYNIGTIDMSLRTTNTMTLATSTNAPQIYGNWINGTGITLSGSGTMTFAGRGSQTITSAGITFTQPLTFNTPGGSVTLQDAFTSSVSATAFLLTQGTFDAGTYNVTFSGASSAVSASGTGIRTLAIGSGTWTIAGSAPWSTLTSTNLTITGTGTISLTSASSKVFSGGNISCSGITVNQGGAGTLSISGNNTFKDITNTYSATGATTISLGNQITTLTQFTGTGAAAKLLTLSGTSAASPATLILSSGTVTTPDYLTISNVRAYSLSSTWYAGANSTNAGSLGWIFAASGGVTYTGTISETATATDSIDAFLLYLGSIAETATATDSTTVEASTFNAALTETATSSDTITVVASTFNADLSETILSTDSTVGYILFSSSVDETATTSDSVVGYITFPGSISEALAASDSISAVATFLSVIAESGTATDAVEGYITFPASIAESATGTDSTASVPLYLTTILENATATDATSSLAAFVGTVLETGTATDAVNAPGSIYNPSITESSTATDATVGYILFPATIAETATSTDQVQAFTVFIGSVSESATSTDATSAVQLFNSIIEEIGTAADSITVAPSIFNAPVVELVTGTDATRGTAIFPNYIVETISITDLVIGAYLWNPINDDQTASWNPVNDAQSVTWSAVNDSQTPNWQNVNNSQPSGWINVDDDQTPGWTPVLP